MVKKSGDSAERPGSLLGKRTRSSALREDMFAGCFLPDPLLRSTASLSPWTGDPAFPESEVMGVALQGLGLRARDGTELKRDLSLLWRHVTPHSLQSFLHFFQAPEAVISNAVCELETHQSGASPSKRPRREVKDKKKSQSRRPKGKRGRRKGKGRMTALPNGSLIVNGNAAKMSAVSPTSRCLLHKPVTSATTSHGLPEKTETLTCLAPRQSEDCMDQDETEGNTQTRR